MTRYGTALITGASGGLGAAFARSLAADGVAPVLVARRADALAALADQLRAAHGVAAETLPADLADPAGLAAVEARLTDPERPVDLLVNCAGIVGGIGPLPHQDPAALDALVALNVTAALRLTRAAVGPMAARGRGGVLNVASTGAFAPAPGGAAYGASKAFLVAFSESVHGEVTWLGVHVTALCPGAVRTGVHDASGHKGKRIGRVLEADAVVREGLAAVAAGRPVHVPGLDYRARARLARLAPALVRRRRYTTWGRRTAQALAAPRP
ncbi:dehydrogenase [Actinomadura cremea]|nr:dehydrogenase [Actinomadura cremea]